MNSYSTPGVYFETRDFARKRIERVRTDIAGFVGIAERGPLHEAVRIHSFLQFTSRFGRHTSEGYLAYAVEGFFANGGRTCHVVRVADPDRATPASVTLADFHGHKTLKLTARDPGSSGRNIVVRIDSAGREHFTLTVSIDGNIQEIWRDLSIWTADERYAPAVINGPREDHRRMERGLGRVGSAWIQAIDLQSPSTFPDSNAHSIYEADTTNRVRGTRSSSRAGRLAGGTDGIATLRPMHFTGDGAPAEETWGVRVLEMVDEVAILAVPDIVWQRAEIPPATWSPCANQQHTSLRETPWPQDVAQRTPFDEEETVRLQRAMIGHCEQLKDRFAIIDVTHDLSQPEVAIEQVVDWRNQYRSKYAALYYPWLRVPGPNGDRADLATVPPSGHVAGLFARVDRTFGVHKPPANEVLELTRDLTIRTDDAAHGFLNDRHVNVIRALPGRGIRIAGARTLADHREEPKWRFVNVRRLVTMIAESIDEALQWTVFEPNNHKTWLDIEQVIRNLLDELWQLGMLDGATADEAYRVVCDETTNPPEQIDRGLVVCQVGVLPPRPAEYVVVRIGRTENGTQILERQEVVNV